MKPASISDLPDFKPPLVRGIRKYVIGIVIRLHIVFIAFIHYLSPLKILEVLKKLEFLRRQYAGDHSLTKLIRVDGHYYWDMHAPGWPSSSFTRYNEGEMNRIIPFRQGTSHLNSMILAITKKCPLKCEHCYEWDVLNARETLSCDDLVNIVRTFQNYGKGVSQVQLSGGEPLARYDDLVRLLNTTKNGTEFWIVTSGYHLTPERALELKKSGLKGIAVSLDHFDPEKHNSFRGSRDSFQWVVRAIQNAHRAKLVVILSLCPTREFISWENMMNYAFLARRLGAAFILIIEPRAVGHYAGRDVEITGTQVKILEDFFLKMNYDPGYADMPAVSYHGYHQRRVGCFGSGDRYLYIDTDGDMHICPFCRQKIGNVLETPIQESMELIRKEKCFKFRQAKVFT